MKSSDSFFVALNRHISFVSSVIVWITLRSEVSLDDNFERVRDLLVRAFFQIVGRDYAFLERRNASSSLDLTFE